jgi:hypothetical protein
LPLPSSAPDLRPLARLVELLREQRRRVQRYGGKYLLPLPHQLAFWQDPARLKLLRLGQQVGGKTTAGLIEVDWRCQGTHPHLRTHRVPIECWIVSPSWKKSVEIQGKFWDLCNKDALDPGTRFDRKKGFVGQSPVIEYKNGSIIRFKTAKQDALDLASGTIPVIMIDEPPPNPRVTEELRARGKMCAGVLLFTLTPINGEVQHIQEMCKAGIISDHHHRLAPELFIPVGRTLPRRNELGEPYDAAFIAQERLLTSKSEAAVTLDAEWEIRAEGRAFEAFDPTPDGEHITEALPAVNLVVCLGIDHGEKTFKQVTVLVGINFSGEHPAVHAIAEVLPGQWSTPEQDAPAILDMLGMFGWSWKDVDHATGDRRFKGGLISKSNEDIEKEIRRILIREGKWDYRLPLRPRIENAKKGRKAGAGAPRIGLDFLHRCMARKGHFTVHPRCQHLIEALTKWCGADDIHKDKVDALRYAVWWLAKKRHRHTGGALVGIGPERRRV